MAEPIVIHRDGELLDAGIGRDGPMPAAALAELRPQLEYLRMERQPRGRQLDPETGARQPFRFVPVRMYAIDGRGRLVSQRGFADRIRRVCSGFGHPVEDEWTQHPEMRPGRFREDWENLVRRFTFRPRQEEAILAMAASAGPAQDGGLIVAPPGFGKGYCIAAMTLLYPEARHIVVTVSKDVALQNHAVLSKFLPGVGMVGAGRKQTGRVTVYTAKSLANVGSGVVCDVLHGDEAHELAAPSFAEGISQAGRVARRFGYTASPEGRSDRADPELEGLFGPRLFEMSYEESVSHGLVVPIVVVWHDVVLDVNPAAGYHADWARQRHGIWRNHGRNQIIAAAARAYPPDEQVLVLVEKVEHAFHLGALLPEFALCYGQFEPEEEQVWDLAGLVESSRLSRTDSERRQLREGFASGEVKKVIATGVWSRGVSFDSLSVLVLAGSAQGKIAMTQLPGRVSRLHAASGKACGVVHAFRNQFDAGFKAAAYRMAETFRSHGWQQLKARDWARTAS